MNTAPVITADLDPESALERFLTALEARNRSDATLDAYRGDLAQFFAWLRANNAAVATLDQVERVDISEYLAELGRNKISGVSRARKLAAIRELFRSPGRA